MKIEGIRYFGYETLLYVANKYGLLPVQVGFLLDNVFVFLKVDCANLLFTDGLPKAASSTV